MGEQATKSRNRTPGVVWEVLENVAAVKRVPMEFESESARRDYECWKARREAQYTQGDR